MRNSLALFLVLSSCLSSIPSFADATKVSSYVQKQLSETGSAQVLVVMKEQAEFDERSMMAFTTREQRLNHVYQALVETADRTQKNLVQYLDANGLSYQRFFISNIVLVENAGRSTVNELAQRADVEKLLGNPSVKLVLPQGESSSSLSVNGVGDNLTAVGVDKVWNTLKVTGQNIVVGGQDTGYQWDHPALKSHYRGWSANTASHDYNWHDSIHKAFNPEILSGSKKNKCGYNVKAPCDDDRHGTHTMGTMIGSDGSANQIGVAPGAKWIGCRNMDGAFGSPASYLECFQFFLAPTPVGGNAFRTGKPSMAPHVINNSWGCPSEEGCTGAEILPALKAMKAAGILVVASAGNDGPGCSTIKDPPAYHTQYVLNVGAFDHRSGKIASFSSRGPSTFDKLMGPDIVAPGVSIRSSVPGNAYEGLIWSGTSMSGPHVVGLVALMWSAQPKLIGHIDETIALIRKNAKATQSNESCGGVSGSANPNNTYGYGRIQMFETVKGAQALR